MGDGRMLKRPGGLTLSLSSSQATEEGGSSTATGETSSTSKKYKARRSMGMGLSLNIDRNLLLTSDGTGLRQSKLSSESNGANFYHGSKSGSLLAFTESAGRLEGRLAPMGELLQEKQYPFSGEAGNALHPRALNRTKLSVVDSEHAGSAYDYATSPTLAQPFNINTSSKKVESAKRDLLGVDTISRNVPQVPFM